MSTTGNDGALRAGDAVEALLEHATPRPAPPSEDERMVREAVLSEWQTATGKRRTRTRLTRFAVAATVLLGVALSFNMLNGRGVAPMQVATIGASHGSIHVLGDQSEVRDLADLTVVTAGQTIWTKADSAIGLEWGGGGSLRVAADTRIEFTSGNEIYLRSGKVYFDSTSSTLVENFRIRTDQGVVTHVGTQYMTESRDGELVVSVREGEVMIDGNYHDERALDGQRISITGSARGSTTNLPRFGGEWSWVEEVSPMVDTDGRSVAEFLTWVERETGLQVDYPDAATEQAATNIILRGNVNLPPHEALDFWLQGQDLNWDIDGGVINVSSIDGISGQ